jgi:hypothetical protein
MWMNRKCDSRVVSLCRESEGGGGAASSGIFAKL